VDLDAAVNVASDGPSPEEELERTSEKECLLGCLSKLGEQDQELVRLKFGAELTNRQIAKLMNLSETNVGVKLFRTLKRLRQDFEGAWGG
jgi:RNA polymerase sigma-70 factor (ECF subfamily)